MKILHIIRHLEDTRAIETARQQISGHEVTLLLLHDAVLSPPSFAGKVYAGLADVEARTPRPGYETLDYPEIVRLICENDKVVSW